MINLIKELLEPNKPLLIDIEQIVFHWATFKKDFFPWRKGDKCQVLRLESKEEGTWLIEMKDGKEYQSVRVKMVRA